MWLWIGLLGSLVVASPAGLQAQGLDTLFVDDFDDGDISDWNLTLELGGVVDVRTTDFHSFPYSLHAYAPGYDAVATAASPFVDFPLNRNYRVTFWFKTPTDTNEYFIVFRDHHVFLSLFGTNLSSASGPEGGGKWTTVATLSVDTFHFIDLRVRPRRGVFDVYVDNEYQATLETFISYVSDTFFVGSFGDGYGEGYWDDFCITNWPRTRVIAGVPDRNQPPQSGTCCWSVPTAALNILEFWENEGLTPGILDGWAPAVAADSIGWFMGTNGTGSPDRLNNSSFPVKGTRVYDVFPGLRDFAAWGGENPDSFSVPWAPNASKTEWIVDGDMYWYWSNYQIQTDSGWPSILIFDYWNPESLVTVVFDTLLNDSVYFYTWGPYQDSSVSPREYWDMEMGVGHGATGVGYYMYYDPDGLSGSAPCTTWVLVHDTWAQTPRTLAVPLQAFKAVVVVQPFLTMSSPPLRITALGWDPPHPPFFSEYDPFASIENTSDSLLVVNLNVDFVEADWGFWAPEYASSMAYVDTIFPGEIAQLYADEPFYQEGLEDSLHRWEVENFWVYTHEFQVYNPHTHRSYHVETGPSAHRGRLTAVMDTATHALQIPVPVYNTSATTCTYQLHLEGLSRGWNATLTPSSLTLTPESTAVAQLQVQRQTVEDTVLHLKLVAQNLTLADTQELHVEIHVLAPRFEEDFSDCDLSDWTVDTVGGGSVGTTEAYVIPPCGLQISSVGYRMSDTHAWVRSPSFALSGTAPYTLSFYIMPFYTEYFTAMDNHQVTLVMQGGDKGSKIETWVELFGLVGDTGMMWIGTLEGNNWNYVACLVNPEAQTYEVYLNGYYMETVPFHNTTTFPYLQFGDFSNGVPDTISGAAFWDLIRVLPYQMATCFTGDVNGDEEITAEDLEDLAQYLFYNGSQPSACADVNGDLVIDPLDLVALSQMLYGKGTGERTKRLVELPRIPGKPPAKVHRPVRVLPTVEHHR